MKILVVFHDNNIYSGASRSMLSLVNSWHNVGISVIALVPGEGKLSCELKGLGIETYKVPVVKTRYNGDRKGICSCLFSYKSRT